MAIHHTKADMTCFATNGENNCAMCQLWGKVARQKQSNYTQNSFYSTEKRRAALCGIRTHNIFLAQRSSQASPLISYSLNVSETRHMSSSPSSHTVFLLALTSLCLASVALRFDCYSSSHFTVSPVFNATLHLHPIFIFLSVLSV